MEKIIVVRHGEDRLNSLTEHGCGQIKALAEKLKSFVSGDVLILTSPKGRAIQSAEILGSVFNVKPETEEILWSESDQGGVEFPDTLDLVRSRKDKTQVLVLVTHHEHAAGFPAYFARQELGTMFKRWQPIKQGEAWIIDCRQKTLIHVS